MTPPLRLLRAAALAGAFVACHPANRETVDGVSPSRYTDAVVALRRLATDARSPAEFQTKKAETLSRLHVTDAQLQAFARAHAADAALMSAVWDTVEARLERTTTPPAPPAR